MIQYSEADALLDEWRHLRKPERAGRFRDLSREQMDNFFLALDVKSQSELVFALPEGNAGCTYVCWRPTMPPI